MNGQKACITVVDLCIYVSYRSDLKSFYSYWIVMAKLASKSGTKSVVWGYFGLKLGTDKKTINDGSAAPEVIEKKYKQSTGANLLGQAHFQTNHPSVISIVLYMNLHNNSIE